MISVIVAIARNRAIGFENRLLYRLPDDLKRFKAVTMGKPVVMGRKTFESLPGGALPGRRNIVITRNEGYEAPGVEVAGSLDEALAMTAEVEEVMIIGGAEIYRMASAVAQRVYLTLIESEVADADTFIAPFDKETWAIIEESDPMTDPRSGVVYRFLNLQRR